MTRKEKTVLLGFAVSAILALIATVLMLIPPENIRPFRLGNRDKVLHFLAFFALTLPAIYVRPRAWVWVLPLAILLGGAIEIMQPYFGRGREFADLVADALGAGMAVIVGHWLNAVASKRGQAKKLKRAQ